MFDQNDPYAAIATPLATPTPGRPPMLGQPPRAPMVGPPPVATPQAPAQEALTNAQARAAAATAPVAGPQAAATLQGTQLQNQALQLQQSRGGLTPEQYSALVTRRDGLGEFERSLNEIEGLYRRDYRSRATTALGFLPDSVSPTNQAFNQASNRLMSMIAQAQGLSAQQQNTPAELRIRFGPLVPTSTDTDESIENKLHSLRDMLNTQRQSIYSQLGQHPPASAGPQGDGDASSMWGQAGAQGAASPGGTPPVGPAGGPTGGRAVNAAGDPITAADIPQAPGDLRLSGQTDAHQPFTQQQQADFINAIRGYQPGTLTADQYAREFERNMGRPIREGTQAAVDYYNGAGQYRGQPQGRVSTNFLYENPDETQSRRDTEAASARLAAMTPEQRFYDSQNPLRHPVEAAAQLATHAPFLTGSGDPGQAAVNRGILDIPTFGFRDEINGTAQGGTGVADERALDASDWQNHPFLRGGGEVAGALAIPAAAPELGGFRAALMSGAQGMGYGLGSGEGDLSQRAPGAALGLATGLALPPLLNLGGRGARALLSRAPQISQDAQRIAQAGADESVPLSRPIVDPTSRARMMRLESNIGGHAPVRQSLDATQQGIENRVGQLAPNGTADERGAMGSRIQEAGRNYVSSSGQRIGAMYDRASQMAGGTQVLPGTAVQRLDTHLAQLQQNPETNAGLINYLGQVRRDLVDEGGILRPKTVQAIRDMRTHLRGQIDNAGLTHSNAERIMNDVLEGAGHDVNFFLGAQNPAANKLYQQADQEWAGRHREITQIVDRLVGRSDNPMGGGQVMTNVSGLMSGDVPRLRRVMAMLSPAERSDLAATVASRAGYKSSDQPFDLQQFITWQKAIPDSARQVVFGPDGARSIQNLTILTRALQDTQKALNNSRSGAARNAAAFWQSILGGFLPGGAVGVMTGTGATTAALAAGTAQAGVAGAQALARRLSARALMNPDMSRWLAVAPRMSTAGAIRSHIGRLAGIAARNPGLEQEILPFRDSLLNAANDNAERAAAASDPNQNQQQPR